jgi:hypothetical protein
VRLRVLLLSALVLALVVARPVEARKRKPQRPRVDLPTQLENIAAQLYGKPLDESEPLTAQFEKLVLDDMSQWLVAHPAGEATGAGYPYDVRVRHQLEDIFAKVRYPEVANAATFADSLGEHRLVGLGYQLAWSDFNAVTVVALYESGESPMRPLAITHLIPSTNVHFRPFDPPPGATGQFWFLAYGTRMGKSNPRLSAELFSLDGATLRTLWKRADMFDGKISFPGNRVVISYLNEDEFKKAVNTNSPVTRHEAAYHVGPKGFEVVYDH